MPWDTQSSLRVGHPACMGLEGGGEVAKEGAEVLKNLGGGVILRSGDRSTLLNLKSRWWEGTWGGGGASQSTAWHHKGPRHQPVRPCWGDAGHKGCFLRRLRAGKTKPQTNSNSPMGMARPAPIQLHPPSQLPGRACLLGDCSSS